MSETPPYDYPPPGGYPTPGAYPPHSTPPNYALWADRVLAALLDGLIALAVLIAIYVVFGLIFGLLSGIGAGVSHTGSDAANNLIGGMACGTCCIALFLPPIAYFIAGIYNKVYLVGKRGNSMGQGIMKLRVITKDGQLVPMSTLVLRLLVVCGFGLVPFLPILDILWPLWDQQRQTLHDKAVGTFVVKIA